MKPIVINAILKPKDGCEDKLFQALQKVQAASREEAGCIQYDLHKGIDDSTYVLFEAWQDNEALTLHAQSSHYLEYRESIADLLASREVYRLHPID